MKYLIHDIEVDFPYEAYPCQIQFMEAVIQTLKGTSNAILESPTGTGKTLCLLCATIAFQQHFRQKEGKALKIFYASRTHSQLSQVIRELRTTLYHDQVRTAVLGSRDHLCVDSSVNQFRGAELNGKCRQLVRRKACGYHAKVMRVTGPETGIDGGNCVDIEDMFKIGQAKGFCPFFQSRESQKSADIVFVPYNYIVDPQDSLEKSLDLTNAIVIFDEAHNLERTCEDAASIVFGTLDIDSGLRALEEAEEIGQIQAGLTNERSIQFKELDTQVAGLHKLRDILLNVKHILNGFDLTQVDSNGRRESPISGQSVAGLLFKGGALKDQKDQLLATIDWAEEIIAENTESSTASLGKIRQVFSLLLNMETSNELDDNFRAFVQEDDSADDKGGRASMGGRVSVGNKTGRLLSLYCMSASVAMLNLVDKKKVRNILLASGTLSPMELLKESLGIPFGVILENTHVIDPVKQVRVGIVCTGPNKVALNASYQSRNSDEYISDLGNLVVNMARIIPEGALLVFHSYSQMNTVVSAWRQTDIIARIGSHKTVFMEPRNAGELQDVLAQFGQASLANSGGAILFCVCRGKVTEGVDLADNQCRVVIMAGIPFPALMDRKVILKREFLDYKTPGNGSKWYRQEAARTVNQTIGRVIRHRFDYGAILLCDERFRSYSNDLPKWVAPQMKTYSNFGHLVTEMTGFFKNIPSELLRTKKPTRQLGRNNSLNISGGGEINESKQIENIQKLISSVPTNRLVFPSFTPQLPAMSSGTHSFKVSSNIAKPAAKSEVPNTQSVKSELTPFAWIESMKSNLSRKDYLVMKKALKRLLEGAHGQCDITVTDSLMQLHAILKTVNMTSSFHSIIGGGSSFLTSRWEQVRKTN